ncbi:hypothetical protein G9A89_021555 [Geosiphon pyriformis]|nr:hypothetical protein G9A89_021555 [Geosiphon pyriformis]
MEETKVVTKTLNLTVLEFCHAIYTQNQSDLELPEECCPAESVLTYYINARINYHIGKEEEPHDTKLGLYRELSQYTTKKVAVIAATIVKIHRKIKQYANKNFPISTGNTRECANKTKKNSEINQESNQQKLGTPAQTPKKTVTQSIKKQRIYSLEDKSYHFSPENKIQIPLGAALSSTSTPQMPRTLRDIPITRGYSSLFQNPFFQPKFEMGFENQEEESELESKKETSEKTITRPVTGISSQSRNQKTHDQEKKPDIKEATFRNAQGNIIPPPLRPISPPAENGNKMATSYITRLTDFSGEEEETDMHMWLRETQKAIQTNNWNNQRAIQTLSFFLKGTADLGLKSSILGRVRPAYPNSLPETVTLARALELAEKKANHNQIVNIVMKKNKTETLKKRTIPPAVTTENSSLAAIFLFELEKNKTMFSRAALDKKCPITTIYTEATINNTSIKLILDSGSIGSIVILQLVNQLGFKVDHATTSQIITANESTKLFYGEIDSFSFEINGIVISTKVLVMNTTQYQVLVGNNWLTKANATLNWTTQELLINYNSHQARISATCGHFQKPSANQRPTFEFEKNPALPAIETYQLSWANDQRTELPVVSTWISEERSE